MKQIRVLIADANEDFVVQVQDKMESVLGDAADITMITDRDYLYSYFEMPRQLDVLLIHESMYFRGIERHNIEWIYILTEDADPDKSNDGGFLDYIYRFAGLKTIVEKALSGIPIEKTEPVKCQMLLVASPSGGTGKTTTALAVSAALRKRGKHVLFVDTTNMQLSSCWLRDKKKGRDDDFIQDHLLPDEVSKIIEHGIFDFISPFNQPLPALGVTCSDYLEILQRLIENADYDYIVVDSVSDFTEQLAQLMAMAHSVLLITLQDLFSMEKLQKYRSSIDCSDGDKFRLVCGFFRPERKNHLLTMFKPEEISYIPYANFGDRKDLKLLSDMQCYKEIAAMFI